MLTKWLCRGFIILVFSFMVNLSRVTPSDALETLWYNGDWNSGMYSNWYWPPGSCIVYDDFEVTDSNGWIIEAVWSNVALRVESEVTQAFWEIRGGISEGNGGTLLYGGIDVVTKEATGRSIIGDPEYSLKISGLNISLPKGHYWLAVAPVFDYTSSGNFTALVGTMGLNAVGSPAGNNANSFLNWPGKFFEATPVFPHDFSMGVEGRISIPEMTPTATITDITSPAAVTDLEVINVETASLHLTWTAPGDDGNSGTAVEYDIRYLSLPITEENWDVAILVSGEPSPGQANTSETMLIPNIDFAATYYFAMKTADEAGNWSNLSNVVSSKAESVVVYPNPYLKDLGSNPIIMFSNLPRKATIRIYTMDGKLVTVLKPQAVAAGGSRAWDISEISSGVYLFAVVSEEKKQTGKISIIK